MKKTILTAVAVAAMSLSAASQGYVVKITPTEGTPETFPVNSLSEVVLFPLRAIPTSITILSANTATAITSANMPS